MNTLCIEAGVCETRGALKHKGRVREFFFAPALGDEELGNEFLPGDVYLGRVRTVSSAINGIFVDIGDRIDGFLPLKKSHKAVTEGQQIIVGIHRDAIGDKGCVLTTAWKKGQSQDGVTMIEQKVASAAVPCRLSRTRNGIEQIMARASGVFDQIIVDNRFALNAVRQWTKDEMPVEMVGDVFDQLEFEDLIEGALDRYVDLIGGGRLIIDETAGGCVIDVDAGSAAGRATKLVNDKINSSAVTAISLALSRRAIGGRVFIDFLPPSTPDVRKKLLAALQAEFSYFQGGRVGKLLADGVVDITMPKRSRSLLYRACEIAGDDWCRPGWQLSRSWAAKNAIHRLEAILRKSSTVRPHLYLHEELMEILNVNPQWRERLGSRYGARFLIETSNSLKPRSFDLVERG